MKIDFENFALFEGIDKKRKVITNIRVTLADELYRRGQGFACHVLAHKIYDTEGETEISEEEYALLVLFAEQCMSPCFYDSLKALRP